MTTLNTTQLLEYYTAFDEVEDDFFLSEVNFTLEAIYSLNFSCNVDGLLWDNLESTDAYIMKLSGDYYLVGIKPCDEYRDSRSEIYHLRCEKMDELIFDNDLINQVQTPVEVKAQKPDNDDDEGIVFMIANYQEEKDEILQLITRDYDDYYPRGRIEYNQELHLMATPIIEKYLFEQNITQDTKKANKLKI
jgi:hypothetical protein